MTKLAINVVGAGITGLWQALVLARAGHRVTLIEKSAEPFARSASWCAGAMLAPYCEEEGAEPVVRILGLKALDIWKQVSPDLVQAGSLVVARPRDQGELTRFARMTERHKFVGKGELAELEPDLAGRFSKAIYYPEEAHIDPRQAMPFLLDEARRSGVETLFGTDSYPGGADKIVDCRGLGADADLKTLRGVRGERAIIRTPDVNLRRPVRLLHPRFPLYVVFWAENHYMIGATVIESADPGNVTLRSAMELFSAAYAIHPAFAEAEIVDLGAGVRPAFPDNVPRIIVREDRLYVNGLYRHGFLLAPVLAELVRDHLETGAIRAEIFVENCLEW